MTKTDSDAMKDMRFADSFFELRICFGFRVSDFEF
jgi:hypothetical protein